LNGVIGLDYGEKRIGIALTSMDARLPEPLVTLPNENNIYSSIESIIEEFSVGLLVVGMPRNSSGELTKQSKIVNNFVRELKEKTDVEIVLQDESLTSVKAEERLESYGVPYKKSDIDSMAAAILLEDYFNSRREAGEGSVDLDA
jgi:putative holliday junction resolvase